MILVLGVVGLPITREASRFIPSGCSCRNCLVYLSDRGTSTKAKERQTSPNPEHNRVLYGRKWRSRIRLDLGGK